MKFSSTLIDAIYQTNQSVAYDVDMTGVRKRDQLAVMAETCIDAGRLAMFGNEEADEELRALIKEHGYPAVLAETTKYVSLA